MKLRCPINKDHDRFEVHSFSLYDHDDILDSNGDHIETDASWEELQEPYMSVLHCIGCKICKENGDWDNLSEDEFEQFQRDAFKELGYKNFGLTKKIREIENMYESDIPKACPDCGSSIFSSNDSVIMREWRCEDQRSCGWSTKNATRNKGV